MENPGAAWGLFGTLPDAVLAIGGCDKNMPGAMIAMARLDLPSIFVYGGTIKPGESSSHAVVDSIA